MTLVLRDLERHRKRVCKSVTDRNSLTAGSDIRSSNATPLSMLCPILMIKDSTDSAIVAMVTSSALVSGVPGVDTALDDCIGLVEP